MPEIFYNAMVLREPYSGVEVTVHQLACALAQYGSFPACACVPAGHRAIPAAPHLRLRTTCAPVSRSRLLRIVWEQTVLPLLLLRARAPLLHAPAYVAPLLAPCPVVLTIHDLHVMTHPQFCRKRNILHYKLLIPPSVKKAAAIIAFSPYTKQTVLTRFPAVREERIHVIPPGLSQTMTRCTDYARLQAVRQRYGLPTLILALRRRSDVAQKHPRPHQRVRHRARRAAGPAPCAGRRSRFCHRSGDRRGHPPERRAPPREPHGLCQRRGSARALLAGAGLRLPLP
jgi:hypothetical protein